MPVSSVATSPGSMALDRQQIEQVVRDVLRDRLIASGPDRTVSQPPPSHNGGPHPLVVNVSARHCHVTDQAIEVLYGPGAKLTKKQDLYQDGEFASDQTVNIIIPGAPGSRRSRMIPNVRILGPTRSGNQVELSYTDGIFLGIDLPLRISGNIEGTPGCVLIGPAGALTLDQGVIRAARHVHMHPRDCAHYGVKDGDDMKLKIDGPCSLTFDRVRVRENEKVKLEVHIDTDEGNACDLKSATHMELIKDQ